jgi:hypothetical protein
MSVLLIKTLLKVRSPLRAQNVVRCRAAGRHTFCGTLTHGPAASKDQAAGSLQHSQA